MVKPRARSQPTNMLPPYNFYMLDTCQAYTLHVFLCDWADKSDGVALNSCFLEVNNANIDSSGQRKISEIWKRPILEQCDAVINGRDETLRSKRRGGVTSCYSTLRTVF